MADNKHLSHIKSKTRVESEKGIAGMWLEGAVKVTENGIDKYVTPKLPEADKLVEGEIAINFAEGVETISHKNSEGDIVTYPNSNILSTDEEIIAAALADHEERINTANAKGDDNEEILAATINAIVGQGDSTDVIESRKSLTQLRSELDAAQEDIETIDEVTASAIAKIVGGTVDTLKDDESLGAVNKSAKTIDEVSAAAFVELYSRVDEIAAYLADVRTAIAELDSRVETLENAGG